MDAKKLYNDGDEDAIKREYRKLSTKIHPDKLPDHTDLATAAFKTLIRAFELLSGKRDEGGVVRITDPAELVQSALDAANSGEAEWHYHVLSLSGRDVSNFSGDMDIKEAYNALKQQLEAAPDSKEKVDALDAIARARIEALVVWVKGTHRWAKGNLTRDGAVKVLMLRAPGRIAVGSFSKF